MGLWHSVSKKCFNPSDYILSSKNDNINTKFPNSSYEVTKMDRQENENKAEDKEYTVVKATRSNTNRDNIYLAVPSTSRDTKVDTNRNTTSTKRKTTKPNTLNDALLKTHKSLNCFTNFTSNFRRLNPKPLTSIPKRCKNIRIDTCDIQSKKKQSNWMLRFNCTKSKHGKASKNHESSTDPKHCTLKHYFKGSSSDICNAESDCDKNPEVNNKPGCSRLKTNDNFIVVYKCSSLNNIPNEALYNDMEAGFDESSMDGAHQGCSSATESFYGSISDINNQFDTSFDLAKLSSKNINVVSGSLVHPLSCVKLVCPFQETDPRGCIQLVCPTDNVKKVCCCNNSNSARTSSTSNLPQTSTTSSEQPTTDTQNKSEPGSDCLLQLVWRTDLNVESLRVLLASHCNVDGVMSGRCHTQVDYMHYLVPELSNITACSFYWGKMDRYEAERLLDGRPEGTFLLRDSAQEEFLFSVSFRKYGRSLHARIEQWNHRFSFDSHDPGVFAADTVCGLIEHYKDPTCCLFFEPMLTRPLHRVQPFSLQHLCRATIADRLRYDDIDILRLPSSLRTYLKEYHYRQRVRVKRFDSSQLQWVELNT